LQIDVGVDYGQQQLRSALTSSSFPTRERVEKENSKFGGGEERGNWRGGVSVLGGRVEWEYQDRQREREEWEE
jgi:hypothetical protein